MTQTPLLSVIIPSYNTGDYIAEAVLSVKQDVPSAQIIVIDDASTDNTLQNLQALKIDSLKFIALKENSPGGAGYPSNIGIQEAVGKYIAFVDSDDFFYKGYLSSILKKMEKTDADICMTSYRMTDTVSHVESPAYDHQAWKRITCKKSNGELNKEQYFSLSPEPWRKIYHARLFQDNRVRFPVNGWFNEDFPFHWFCGLASRGKLIFENRNDYYHRIRRSGQTTSVLDERTFFIFDHTNEILNFMESSQGFCRYKGCLLNWLLIGAWKLRFLSVRIEEYYHSLRGLILSFDSAAVQKMESLSLNEQKKAYLGFKNSENIHDFLNNMGWSSEKI